jgi:hypothetical protein
MRFGLLGNDPAVAHHRGSSINRRESWLASRAPAAGPGNTSVRRGVSAEVPDSVCGTVAAPLSAALDALRMTETTTRAHDLSLGDPMPLPTSPRVESIPHQQDPGPALAVLWSADLSVEED